MKRPLSILIVDDERNSRNTLQDILDAKGYVTFSVDNGYSAIEQVQRETVDIALMDYKMPGINGLETFRKIHVISPGLKVIFVTAYHDEDTLHSEENSQIAGICYKPLDIDKLLSIIERIGTDPSAVKRA